MSGIQQCRFTARFAQGDEDIYKAQRLRWLAFVGARGVEGPKDALDADDLDAVCQHVLIEDSHDGSLVCCFRIMPLTGSQIVQSYSARYYNLNALKAFKGNMVEMGRFCIDPSVSHPDIMRAAWAAMTRYVDENSVEMIFGCSSFIGTDPQSHIDAFTMLREKHLAPKRWFPRVKAPDVFRFASQLCGRKADLKRAIGQLPPLLRSYLLMGGWVSDHAVIDRHLNTLHVFTGLEVNAIPAIRKKLLRGTVVQA